MVIPNNISDLNREWSTLRAVLRGIPQIPFTGEVRRNLKDMRFDVISIARMYKKVIGSRIDMPLILVQLGY